MEAAAIRTTRATAVPTSRDAREASAGSARLAMGAEGAKQALTYLMTHLKNSREIADLAHR